MYRIAVALFIFIALVCFGAGSNVYAQCPDIRGTWAFQSTYIQVCYITDPQMILPKGTKPFSYTPGTIQGQELSGEWQPGIPFSKSGNPTYTVKWGDYEIYQGKIPDSDEFYCYIHAKRVHKGSYQWGYNGWPSNRTMIPPREDWYTGVIHGGGTKLTMRAIPSASSPSVRLEGEISTTEGQPSFINFITDTDFPEQPTPYCYPILNTGVGVGDGYLYNRQPPPEQ